MNTNSLFIFILTIFISIQIPYALCQSSQYETCSQPFHCGPIRDITYPFWGGYRSISCGHPGFELNCENNYPLLNISSRNYRLLDINNANRTITIARKDLLNEDLCPSLFYNTTLDFTLFNFSSSDDQNITLHYSCNIGSDPQRPDTIPYQFECNNTRGSNFYLTRDGSGLGYANQCENVVSVPVNQAVVRNLENPGPSSRAVLGNAIAFGFTVEWVANNRICEDCVLSGGLCGYIPDGDSGFFCYCAHGNYMRTCNYYNENVSSRWSFRQNQRIFLPLLGSVIVVAFLILVYCYRNKCTSDNPDKESNRNVEIFILNHGNLAPKRYKYREIKKLTKSFTVKLGQGGFGSVYKGKLPDGRFVAVKVLSETNTTNGEEFINEVASISRTSHVNIVNLLGFCNSNKKRALVYEFMPNKSLDKFINKKCYHLGWDKLYNIAVGVARGLEYLHRGCNNRIIHFDIKPQNVLLDDDFCPKISDFGLAKLCKKKQSVISSVFGLRGTVGYIAPEVFCRNFGGITHKCDVYSYGMMVLEMAGAREIEEAAEIQSSENYFPDNIYEQGVLRMTKQLDEVVLEEECEILIRKMFLIGFWCIQTDPSDRPSMSKVVEMLEGNMESIKVPPKPSWSAPMLAVQQFTSSCTGDTGTEDYLSLPMSNPFP